MNEQNSSTGAPGSEVPVDPPVTAVREAVSRAIEEDLLPLGDLTGALLPEELSATGVFVSRARGVLAGRFCVTEVFSQVDPRVELRWHLRDGDLVDEDTVVADIAGPMRSLLAGERTALNFLCHLSGVATLTRRYVEAVRSANALTTVLDTRKTTPGLRALEKAAVRAGGGRNHRGSLSDAILLKDNHLLGLSIKEAVSNAAAAWPGRLVEVECDHIDQVAQALSAGAGAVLLDNMDAAQVENCVKLVRELETTRVLVEVSGGVTLDSAPALARAGADLISVGALTHSAPVLDLSLDLDGRTIVSASANSGG